MTEIIKEGDNLPDISIKAIVKDEIKESKLSNLFADHSLMHPKNKKIVLFSVPGGGNNNHQIYINGEKNYISKNKNLVEEISNLIENKLKENG